jgi:TM2 domain-containing membrane protein YozV
MASFYQGQIAWGIVKLVTFGALGIWWFIDAIYYTVQAGKR